MDSSLRGSWKCEKLKKVERRFISAIIATREGIAGFMMQNEFFDQLRQSNNMSPDVHESKSPVPQRDILSE